MVTVILHTVDHPITEENLEAGDQIFSLASTIDLQTHAAYFILKFRCSNI